MALQVTDAVFTNSIAKVSLLGAHDLATLAGHQPNATFKAVAEGLRILYDKQRDFHPAYICGDTGKEYNTTCVRLFIVYCVKRDRELLVCGQGMRALTNLVSAETVGLGR